MRIEMQIKFAYIILNLKILQDCAIPKIDGNCVVQKFHR